MLEHTTKIKEMYEDLQKKIFYMIPEKWESLYLYASVIESQKNQSTGELFFYYIPKGILKKKIVNVYEIPSKFNLNQREYLQLVDILYNKIIEIREEFKKQELLPIWTNLTIIMNPNSFKVQYDYEDLSKSEFNNYERHIIWRYKYLGITEEKLTKSERKIISRFLNGVKMLTKKEVYESEMHIKNIKNIVDFDTENLESKNIEYITDVASKKEIRNEILVSKIKQTK